jgi:UDP:flavonoid glycosyltransferase YjiC (YdhE family)
VPRVLLAWEFGGDLGHVRRSLAIARRLRERGHEPLLAFTDTTPLAAARDHGIPWVQAPLLVRPAVQDEAPLNASDILLNLGFGDAPGLAGALRGWTGLLRAWRPAGVVADYAPTALLAARAAGLRRVTLGSGFSSFPIAEPMPSLRPQAVIDRADLARRDSRLVTAVAQALERAAPRAPAPQRASEIFAADAHLVCTWPAFDPFGPREGVEYLGPQDDSAGARPIDWMGTDRPRVFGYLKPRDLRFPAVLAALERVAGEAIVAAPGMAPAEAAALTVGRVRVLPEPVVLDRVLREADLCMSHAGPGTTAAAAALGIAQALLPLQLEQYLVARRLAATGAARLLEPGEVPDFDRWLADAMNADARSAAAALRADASRPRIDAADRIARMLAN